MSDLTDEDIKLLHDGLCETKPKTITLALCWRKVRDALAELMSRRAEHAAGREHVERVVREVTERFMIEVRGGNLHTWSAEIASRVADRLSVPVLSEEDLEILTILRKSFWFDEEHDPQAGIDVIGPIMNQALALLDRLIAAGKP